MSSPLEALPTALVLPFCICDLMTIFLISGALLLAISLFFVRKLARELPRGLNRTSWRILGGFIMLFIVGYLGFYLLKRGSHYDKHEMVVPVVFFFGAIFVLLVCFLAYRTTKELKRVVELEQETITDPLLGIFNRRFLDRRLQEELLRAQRHGLPLSLMLLDIDFFKKVNDTWGHQNGDIVLKHLAKLLVDTLRQTDLVARFGGEEFVLLLPHTHQGDARMLAERLRRTVEQTPVLITTSDDGYQELRVTISIGLSCMRQEGDNCCDMLERADKALYQAKQTGRNRVISCDDMTRIAQGEEVV